MMFYIERIRPDGAVELMMASPHRIGIEDLRPPPGPSPINQNSGAFYMNEWPSPGNKSAFSGAPGYKAQVRWNDIVVEKYEWTKVPQNPFAEAILDETEKPANEMEAAFFSSVRDKLELNTDYLWGWKLIAERYNAVPFEELHPLSFIG